MVRRMLAIDHEETYFTSRTPQPMCQFLYNIWITLFPRYLSHCCCCLTIQYGIVSYSVMGITVVTIPVFINATEGWILHEMIIPFVLMCIYSVIMFAGHFLTIMSAFMFNRKLLQLGVIITAVGMVLWLILLIAAFFPRSSEDYVCINHVCADSQWLIDLRWRYKKSDCPFRKGDPSEYPVFRKDFFVDAPRDELWQDNKRLAISLNLALKKAHLMDQEHSDKVINFKAWYPGCESNDTVLILISVILAVTYACFIGHLWWMVLSLRYLIVEEENEYDAENDEASY